MPLGVVIKKSESFYQHSVNMQIPRLKYMAEKVHKELIQNR